MTSALLAAAVTSIFAGQAMAADTDCTGLPSNAQLTAALNAVVTGAKDSATTVGVTSTGGGAHNGGLDFPMWATVVNKYGKVCAVATTGNATTRAWPASRVISAQKATTANSLSTEAFALSTANLFTAVQSGNSLYGLQHSNPVNTLVAYRGDATTFGTASDPMVGLRVGGVNVFGGGLALYGGAAGATSTLLGGLGVSGDTSCADHNIAWALRKELSNHATYTTSSITNRVPKGVGAPLGTATSSDNIIYGGTSGFQHASCLFAPTGPTADSTFTN